MLKNPLSTTTTSITAAAIILGGASFVSRLIGIFRDRIFAHMFGAGDVLDAYYAAFRIPDFIFNLLAVGALSAGFIPVFTKLLQKNKDEAWKVANGVFNCVLILLSITCAILFVFAPQLTKYMVPGFAPDKINFTINLTRVMLLSPILLGLSSVFNSVLQSFKNFLVFAITPIMYNIGIIFGALVLVPRFGEIGLAYGVVIGSLLHLIIQIPSLRYLGYKYQSTFAWRDPALKEIGLLIVPRTLGLAVGQINLLVITTIASTLAAGSVAIFNLANNLQFFAVGIIGVSFAVAAFPTLSELAGQNKMEELIDNLSRTIRQILFFIVPLTIIFLILRAQIVRVVLGSGRFDWADTIATADALAFFSLSLFAQALVYLLARAFYALRNTWTPLWIAAISAALCIVLSLYLKSHLGVLGLALAFSLSAIIQMALLWITLRFRLKTLHESKILISLYKISVAGVFMAIIIQIIKTPLANLVDMTKFWGIFTQGAVAGIIGLLIYCLLCWLLRLEEMQDFLSSTKRRLLKLQNVPREVEENK